MGVGRDVGSGESVVDGSGSRSVSGLSELAADNAVS